MSTDLGKRASEIDELVVGWMVPVMRHDPLDGSRPLNGLGLEDFRRVQAGYGCPDCLAKFKTYLVKCPVCGLERDVYSDMQAPPELWVDHLKERHRNDGEKTKPLGFDEFMAEVARDPNIERRRA